jgi:hypothetical protein
MLYLPDTTAHWPVELVVNPHHKEVKAEFDAQFSKFMPHVIELGLEETMRKWDSGTFESCLIFHATDQIFKFFRLPMVFPLLRKAGRVLMLPKVMIQYDILQNYYFSAANISVLDSWSILLQTVYPHPSFAIP